MSSDKELRDFASNVSLQTLSELSKTKKQNTTMIAANELVGNIPGWSDYHITKEGRIFSLRRKREMIVWCKGDAYPRVTLSNKGREKSFTVHRLVATVYIPNPLNKKTVNHIDGNKRNFHVNNLEWATMSENQTHAIRIGLAVPPKNGEGENHPLAKLSNVDVEMIRHLLKADFTQEQIAKRFNIHPTHVSQIKLLKTRYYE